MAAIVDTLLVRLEELVIISTTYPDAFVTPIHPTRDIIRRLRIIIPDEDEDGWYEFLVAKGIAVSSRNFSLRFTSDPLFAGKMKSAVESFLSQQYLT